MKVETTSLPGVLLIEPDVFGDARGFLMETYKRSRYAAQGIETEFIQDNLSYSQRGVLRGLHLQVPNAQAKLVYVLQGEVFDVAVDVRKGSPNFGQWFGATISSENKRQLYAPVGFAHGFCVVSEVAMFAYKCSSEYAPEQEISVRWDDPAIGIEWPISDPQLSQKDKAGLPLAEFGEAQLPRYES